MPTPRDSLTTMTEIVLPTHANSMGTVFGGQILAWMDICAAICAQRHCSSVVVTAGVDDLDFRQPIRVGEVVRLNARVTAAFRSSVEVEVEVSGENPMSRSTWPCVQAFLTFVAIDQARRPVPVPALVAESDADRIKMRDADARRTARLARRAQG